MKFNPFTVAYETLQFVAGDSGDLSRRLREGDTTERRRVEIDLQRLERNIASLALVSSDNIIHFPLDRSWAHDTPQSQEVAQ